MIKDDIKLFDKRQYYNSMKEDLKLLIKDNFQG